MAKIKTTILNRPKEHCGLFGIYGHKEAASLTYLGLYALQHRGEESCGIVSSDRRDFYIHKDMGLVSDVFSPEIISKLKGDIAVGHTRYSTTGSSVIKNVQPLFANHRDKSIAIAHNGNLVNSSVLKKKLESQGSIFQTSCDSEVIIHLMAKEKSPDVVEKLKGALKSVQGAYSLILMTQDKLIGVRDPLGFRPLVLGKIGNSYCLASETCAFDLIEAKYIREIQPGEIVVIDKGGIKSHKFSSEKKKAQCIFEHIYFSRPDSFVFGQTVHLVRQSLGERLAKEHPVKADLVIPVPDSGTSSALGYSHASGIPLEWGIIRNHYIGRTFIQPHQEIRDLGVKVKFNLLKEVIKGKKIVIVDDSIVRGTTSKKRIRGFREAGVKEVHLRISCPPHKFPCFYGIDFPTQKELIAHKFSINKIKEFLGVDSLGYLSAEGMLACVKDKNNYCTACFTGKYPTKFDKKTDKLSLENKCEKG
ncbi:MAG: amidophosphoribosyltransferase [Candidatus Omnitrophica bacterium]|nr:amidophosphoribosyltransferase [Candidatus Omnitrophota bacterium]